MKRTQIYLEDQQDTRLAKRAEASGVTKSTLIREAIDRFLQGPLDQDTRLARFRHAVAQLARDPLDLRDGRAYVEELRAQDRDRTSEIESRRR